MELGILSLSDLQTSLDTGQPVSAAQRIAETIDYAVLGDQLGLDLFALGEHHALDYAVSSPAVVLAAIAARTEQIRLTSAVTCSAPWTRSGSIRTSRSSVHRYATEIAPAVRASTGALSRPTPPSAPTDTTRTRTS